MEPLRTEAQDCWVLCECSGAGEGVSLVLYGGCNSAGKKKTHHISCSHGDTVLCVGICKECMALPEPILNNFQMCVF